MSKVSSSDYPKYSSSSISLGGSNAKTGVLDGVLTSDYIMSNGEESIYNYALNTLASILPQLNTFSPETLGSIQSQVDAYRNKGIDEINQTYKPMVTSLENDIASRFGNLDNSVFKDNLDTIESKRTNAVSSFAQDVLAKQSGLASDELTKRYSLVELLSGLANDIYGNALNAISTALGGSANANNYNDDLYNALSNVKGTGTSANANSLLSSILGLAGNPSSFLNFS